MLDVLVYVAVIGAPVLAIYSVWRRLKKVTPTQLVIFITEKSG